VLAATPQKKILSLEARGMAGSIGDKLNILIKLSIIQSGHVRSFWSYALRRGDPYKK
jgi:hypothetical protein